MRHALFAAALLTGMSIAHPTIAQTAPGGGCDATLANAASAAATAFGVISSITGRATAGLQVAQQLQLLAQTLCDTEQTALQSDQLEEQRRMTARLGGNAAATIGEIERAARDPLGSIDDALYGAGAEGVLEERYQVGMPPGWTFETAPRFMETMRMQTNQATREAAAVHAAAKLGIDEALTLSDEALDLSQSAEGQTQAIQAQTQMMRTLIGVQAAQHASDAAASTAALREDEERRAQEIIADQKIRRFYGPGALLNLRPTGRNFFQ
jgi:hypothetical protein